MSERDGFELNRRDCSAHLAPLAGRGRIASAMRSIVRRDLGEGDYPRVWTCREAPSPRPSPRKRGEGEVIRPPFNLVVYTASNTAVIAA